MFNILCDNYPSEIKVENKNYKIVTDFRDWILFSNMISDNELSAEEKIEMIADWFIDEKPRISDEIIRAVNDFFAFDFSCQKNQYKSDTGHTSKRPVFSFNYDGIYVFADFIRYYNINLKSIEYMHWWQFRSLFLALPDESETKKRIGYRTVKLSDIKDKEERKRIRKIQREIMIPISDTLSDEDIGEIFDICL